MDKENTLYIDLKNGRVVIEMRPDLAPNHVAQIKKLTREGKYDGILFHRVIDGFMAQTGDPDGTGMGGMGSPLKAEFSKAPFKRGTVGMALDWRDTGGSQFFITHSPQPHLDAKYTVIGRVIAGMDVVDRLEPFVMSAETLVNRYRGARARIGGADVGIPERPFESAAVAQNAVNEIRHVGAVLGAGVAPSPEPARDDAVGGLLRLGQNLVEKSDCGFRTRRRRHYSPVYMPPG